MVCLASMLAVAIIAGVYGRSSLPPLPMKDGCYQVLPEVGIFRVEGEAIILQFPEFMRVLEVREIAPPSAKYFISRNNGTESVTYQSEGRVQQSDKELWFLPAWASDSGEYTCTYRNDTYCVTGSITLHVYESNSIDMNKLSYWWSVLEGEKVKFNCPSLSRFNKTDRQIEWYKDSNSTPLQLDRGTFILPAVRRSQAGVYTCRLTVLINEQRYKVSRVILLHVQGTDPAFPTTVPEGFTSGADLHSSSTMSTVNVFGPPVIVSPVNGTIFESPHGSGLELVCQVLTECQMADSTVVTWLINGQSVASSYLDRRALQGGRRVTRLSKGCQIEMRLIISHITEEDKRTEMKCVTQNKNGRQEVLAMLQLEDSTFTWLVVAMVMVSCFLTVGSVFLYVLFKPKRKKKMDYFLARQSSTFSV
ncbi:interleukin-1 receptor type 2 [Kryptolebias marmoratus]|uniref:Interleukin-1 receptor type 2-like n=1 Tax=Kryptolebias marmoratus TaxID=37003 RepID=A0A3Q3ALE4_KRYMA|nr:interleukin-1 receptor type 2 [Kryptolebias marmoratus]XP_037831857.1 interleukin-1 receptor type 2 [Kryptolebias marmoratus]